MGNLIHVDSFNEHLQSRILTLAEEYQTHDAIISTTGKDDLDIGQLKLAGKVIELSHLTPLPIKLVYSTPETLGRDRIAAACGTHFLFPDHNCLIVDAGTCVTMDLLLSTGIYLGGNISPGIRLRLASMHEKTARLPLVRPDFPSLIFGDSTEHALQNGACLGVVMELEGILNRAREAYGEVSVVITGGDSALLATRLESQIFVEPELVTHGLFQILSFNVKNS